MKRKKLIYLCLTLICGIILGGCAHVYELSDEDEDQIAVYSARCVSKYNRILQQGSLNLVTPPVEETSPDETAAQALPGEEGTVSSDEKLPGDQDTSADAAGDASASGETGQIGDAPIVNPDGSETSEGTPDTDESVSTATVKNMGDALGTPGLKFSFVRAKDVTDYNFDGYFDLSPTAGNHFLVLEYKVKNTTDEDIDLNVPDLGVSFRAAVGGAANTSDRTILLNDISSFNGTIKAKKKQEMVLLFQFDPAYLKDLSDIKLQVISGEDKTLVEMH